MALPDDPRDPRRDDAERPPAEGEDEPVETPLDEPDAPPPDLASIPLGPRPDPPDFDEEQPELDGPGMVYEDGRAAPKVGEDDDPPPDDYRPL